MTQKPDAYEDFRDGPDDDEIFFDDSETEHRKEKRTMTNLEKARQRLEILDRMLHGWQSAYNAGTPTMLNGEDVKDFIDDVSTQLFIGTSYLAKVTDHEFENGAEITVPFD